MSAPLKAHERTRTSISFVDSPSLTKQSFKEECDINNILKRWRKTGELTHLATRQPSYGDFTNADDYLSATLKVHAAQADFDSLSARIRERMKNDPAELLAFLADPANEAEGIELGLIPKPASKAAPPPSVETEDPPLPLENEGSPVAGGE